MDIVGMTDFRDFQLLAPGHLSDDDHLVLLQCLFIQVIFKDMDGHILIQFGKAGLRDLSTGLAHFILSQVELDAHTHRQSIGSCQPHHHHHPFHTMI